MSRLPDEMDTVAEHFGVAPAQVERDHLVSHVLAAIARAVGTDDVVCPRAVLSRQYCARTVGSRCVCSCFIRRATRTDRPRSSTSTSGTPTPRQPGSEY